MQQKIFYSQKNVSGIGSRYFYLRLLYHGKNGAIPVFYLMLMKRQGCCNILSLSVQNIFDQHLQGVRQMLIITIRTIILYLLIVFSLRLMGKKQLGELQPSELVTTIMVSNIATLALEEASMPMLMGVVPILMIVCLDVIMSGITLKNTRIRKVVSGSARVIISDGVIDQKELKNLRYTIDDVTEAMREQGIFDISQIQYAIVETNGKINFLQKEAPPKNPPEIIIRDGEINTDGLKRAKLGEGWVKKILKENGAEISSVFIMSADSDGKYQIVVKDKDLK